MEWKGKDCGDGKIKWLSMKSLAGTTRDGFPQGCSWDRKTDDLNWNNKYVGQLWSCSYIYAFFTRK